GLVHRGGFGKVTPKCPEREHSPIAPEEGERVEAVTDVGRIRLEPAGVARYLPLVIQSDGCALGRFRVGLGVRQRQGSQVPHAAVLPRWRVPTTRADNLSSLIDCDRLLEGEWLNRKAERSRHDLNAC